MTQTADERALDTMAIIDRYAATIEGFARNSRDMASCRYTILGCAQNIREQVRTTTRPIRYHRIPWYKWLSWWLGQHDTTICYGMMLAFFTFMLWYILGAARNGRLPAGW